MRKIICSSFLGLVLFSQTILASQTLPEFENPLSPPLLSVREDPLSPPLLSVREDPLSESFEFLGVGPSGVNLRIDCSIM